MASVGKKSNCSRHTFSTFPHLSKVAESGKSVAAAVTKVTDVEMPVLEKGGRVGLEGSTFAMWENVKAKQDRLNTSIYM